MTDAIQGVLHRVVREHLETFLAALAPAVARRDTGALFEPSELLEKLAVIIPRPRINLLLYHGLC
jgi:hypothetical protein